MAGATVLAEPVAIGPALIEGVRVRPSPERTRIVFDLTQPVEHKIFSLDNPSRLVIDIRQASLKANISSLDLANTPIASIRTSRREGNNVRVVLDLLDEVRPRSFVLKPIMQYRDRLVIDLYTRTQQVAPVVQKADQLKQQMRDVIIAIDAGHGGDDPGAIGTRCGFAVEKSGVAFAQSHAIAPKKHVPGENSLFVYCESSGFLGDRDRLLGVASYSLSGIRREL